MVDENDGYRFQFHYSGIGTWEMRDVLGIFKPVTLPEEVAEVLVQMLHEQHEWYVNQDSKLNNLKSLIGIVKENEDIDKDILITCIKYATDYGDEK